MTSKEAILEMLEAGKGKFLSGEEIAAKLNISRNAVWKNINSLKNDGYAIDCVRNKGYLMQKNNDIVSPQGIFANMKHPEKVSKILYYDCVTSTNSVARLLTGEGAQDMTVVVSNTQTQGRGRMGRAFYSPENTGIYMSVILKTDGKAENPLLITTAACVAVTRAIEKVCGLSPQIKWVNDVFLDGRKICGILTEGITSIESGELEYVISGIGINFSTDREKFPDEIKKTAGSLYCLPGGRVSRNMLIAAVLENFEQLCRNPKAENFMDEYRRHSMIIGHDITFTRKNVTYSAKAVGIDDEGGLTVLMPDGKEQTLNSGEVTVRRV